MGRTKQKAKKLAQSPVPASPSPGSSDDSPSEEAQATEVAHEVPATETATPEPIEEEIEEEIPPKPVPADKMPKRKAQSSGSSDEEPALKKANMVETSPVKPKPAVNVKAVNNGQARRHPSAYTRIQNTTYNGPAKSQDREWWGNNVKGKKFRKEKGKKKRSQHSGVKIDGAVKSFRLDNR